MLLLDQRCCCPKAAELSLTLLLLLGQLAGGSAAKGRLIQPAAPSDVPMSWGRVTRLLSTLEALKSWDSAHKAPHLRCESSNRKSALILFKKTP